MKTHTSERPTFLCSVRAAIRRVALTGTGTADGTGSAARFGEPTAVASDAAGNLCVGDIAFCDIRLITPSAVVSTVAGVANNCHGNAAGVGTAGSLGEPQGRRSTPRATSTSRSSARTPSTSSRRPASSARWPAALASAAVPTAPAPQRDSSRPTEWPSTLGAISTWPTVATT
jgi:hypothetical protein